MESAELWHVLGRSREGLKESNKTETPTQSCPNLLGWITRLPEQSEVETLTTTKHGFPERDLCSIAAPLELLKKFMNNFNGLDTEKSIREDVTCEDLFQALFLIFVAVVIWSDSPMNHWVVFWSDNLGIVWAINRQSASRSGQWLNYRGSLVVSVKRRVRWIHHLSWDEHVSCSVYLFVPLNS